MNLFAAMLANTRWSLNVVEWAVDVSMVLIVVGVGLCVVRLVRGPHLGDRALALDTIAVHLIGLVILLTIRLNSLVLFDGVLVLSLLGFAGTVAVGQYIARQHVRSGARRPRDADD